MHIVNCNVDDGMIMIVMMNFADLWWTWPDITSSIHSLSYTGHSSGPHEHWQQHGCPIL